MTFLLLALISAFLGAVPALIGRKPVLSGVLFVIYFLLSGVIYYTTCPSLNFIMTSGPSLWTLVLMIVSCVLASVANEKASSGAVIVTLVYFFAIAVCGMSSCTAGNSTRYAALIGPLDKEGHSLKHWTQQTEEVSPTHLRVVPVEHAISIAKTSLNQNPDDQGDIVGSQFTLLDDNATLQKVKDELVWVIPLDYRSWGSYNGTTGVPGYVLVNAENQHVVPRYIRGYKMLYTPEAFWDHNLERHLYTNGYSGKILKDYSFEVDDSLNPFWVVSVCHSTIGGDGIVVDGVAVVNPENGLITYYDKSKAPLWIDRVIPEEIVQDNISYWGRYSLGFMNRTAVGAQANLRTPETSLLNYGEDGTCWYVTPVKASVGSGKNASQTMTDLIYTNSRTGESKRYSVSGSTEEALTNSVNSTVKFQHLHPAAIIFENVGDKMTAVMPILAEDHSIKGLALIDVVSKTMAWDPDPQQALMKYQSSLSSISSAIGTDQASLVETFSGKVTRISSTPTSSGSIYYLYFDNNPHLYSVSQTFPGIVITQPGDNVTIQFLDMASEIIAVNDFKNSSVKLTRSANEQAVQSKIERQKIDQSKDALRTSAKNTMRNGEVTDQDLDSIAVQIAKRNKKKT
ncbi:MAG: hypothetical protein JWM20_482 [Patescibacteria group bacterium]|nr:hypothetical protein [Patescibacteria group bacterium]